MKILDFGLARSSGQDAGLTQTGTIMGTPAFMAPEQARGEKVDARCDLWSVGVVLYACCTGQLPFKGNDAISTLVAVAGTDPLPPPRINSEVPAGLSELIMKLLEKDPAKRISTAGEVVEAIELLEGQLANPTPAASPAASTARAPSQGSTPALAHASPPASRSRKPLLFALGVGIAVLLAGAVAVAAKLVPTEDGGTQPENLEVASRDEQPEKPVGEVPQRKPDGAKQGNKPSDPGRKPEENPVAGWPKSITNSIGMKLMLIPAGKFLMGSSDIRRAPAVCGSMRYKISKEFYLGAFEVTQKQFKEVMGYNPSFFSRNGRARSGKNDFRRKGTRQLDHPTGGKARVPADTGDFPVENLLWEEAVEFCNKLSQREDEKRQGRKYRLPTEAEWEYSCRAGTPPSQHFHVGNSLDSSQANFNPLNTRAPKTGSTRKVGSYPANPWGLHDMHGNVSEWCSDWFGIDYYNHSPKVDPPGPPTGGKHVIRGGAWHNPSQLCQSAHRMAPVHIRTSEVGFRVALTAAGR